MSPLSVEDGDQALEGFQIGKEERLLRAQPASSFLPPEHTNKAVPGEPLIEIMMNAERPPAAPDAKERVQSY